VCLTAKALDEHLLDQRTAQHWFKVQTSSYGHMLFFIPQLFNAHEDKIELKENFFNLECKKYFKKIF
jgi:hypothetical protein